MVNYTTGILWMLTWPALIYISYKFIVLNIEHFDKENKQTK